MVICNLPAIFDCGEAFGFGRETVDVKLLDLMFNTLFTAMQNKFESEQALFSEITYLSR